MEEFNCSPIDIDQLPVAVIGLLNNEVSNKRCAQIHSQVAGYFS
ncbi:hypothetical protein [Paenibacillus sp. GSMTC-2017]|nr:hypothetical protein [Paenibacillus sp. GSMTC-2017]